MSNAAARQSAKGKRADTYRQRAAQLRALAEELSGENPKALNQAADDYDRMAANADGADGKSDGARKNADGADAEGDGASKTQV